MISFNQKLKSTDDREYWITSDLHFYHKRILELCPDTRPWGNIEDMIEGIVDEWNSKVKPEDVIFSLGDFSFAGKEKTQRIIDRLNGNIVWILGNHCYKVFGQMEHKAHHYLEVKYDGKKVCMMHYPITAWNQQGHGSICLFGHSHNSLVPQGKMLDVGWDSLGRIITLKEAIGIADKNEIYCPDHHKIIVKES